MSAAALILRLKRVGSGSDNFLESGSRKGSPLRATRMRYVVIGFCVFAAACGNAAPTAPTSSLSQTGGGIAEARGGSALPFKGDLHATEAVAGNLHHLAGAGNGTNLGGFTYTADITVDEATGEGKGTVAWTAANGDRVFASTTGGVVLEDFPTIGIRETQVITGGTGRFAGASGSVIVDRSLDLLTGATSGSYNGTINLGY